MTVAGYRHQRIAGEIQQEIGTMLAGELKDPRLAALATVTEVRVAHDLKQVRVYVSVMGSDKERAAMLKGLAAASGFIRRELCVRLRLRKAPEVHFVLDLSQEYGEHIDDLIRSTKNLG